MAKYAKYYGANTRQSVVVVGGTNCTLIDAANTTIKQFMFVQYHDQLLSAMHSITEADWIEKNFVDRHVPSTSWSTQITVNYKTISVSKHKKRVKRTRQFAGIVQGKIQLEAVSD